MDLVARAVTLKSIKLHDPLAKNILFSARHAVLYAFNNNNWEKTGTEGCLAIYQTESNQNRLFILNRLQPENFSCSLREVVDLELQGELLMFSFKSGEVQGIWLFDEAEREAAFNCITKHKDPTALPHSHSTSTAIAAARPVSISISDLMAGASDSHKQPAIKATPGDRPAAPAAASIMNLLEDAKRRSHQPPTVSGQPSLEDALQGHFAANDVPDDLSSFALHVAKFLKNNPQVLRSLHHELLRSRNET